MSKSIIIQEAGLPQSMTIDALRLKKLGNGSEEWAFASGDTSSFIKMSIGKNAEINATDYNVQAITEVNVTQKIMGIETEPDEVEIITEPRMVSIREGNKPRLMSGIKKLRVNLQSGGTTELVPKSSVATGILYATKIGEYKAADDGYVGYSRVYVNVPESENGGADGGWTDLPDEIKIISPPHKTTYDDGESIDITGMVVQARKNGVKWENDKYINGIIPLNEIELSSNIAELYKKNGYTHIKFRRDKVPSGIDASYMPDVFIVKHGHYGMWALYYEWGTPGNRKHKHNYRIEWAGEAESVDDIVSTIFSIYNGYGVLVQIGLNGSKFSCYTYGNIGSTEETDLATAKQRAYTNYDKKAGDEKSEQYSVSHSYISRIIDGKEVNYEFAWGGVGPYANNPNDDAAVNTITGYKGLTKLDYAILYSILFGDREIELKWKRPRDNAILSTMLYINIFSEM